MKINTILIQNLKLKSFTFLVLFTFLSFLSFSQSKIFGKVIDKTSGQPLVGVTVSIKGTTNGTATDLDGHYELIVKPGTYDLITNYIQYKEMLITGIVVVENKATLQDIILEEVANKGIELDGVTISRKAKTNTTEAVNIERKKAVSVSDGVSSKQFGTTSARSASDVLKQVAGTTIQENKFAIIRGMNDRYNAAYLNGAPLPSTESDRKAFAFNLIPSNLIDNIIVYKGPSPDLQGDFAGGVIMINTKSIPDSKSSQFNFSTGTHSLTTFKSFSHFRQSSSDILGFDDGSRQLPESRNFKEGLSKSEYVDITKKFNNDWKIYSKTAMPNTNLGYSWGRSFKHHENSFGTLASFTYSNNYRFSAVNQRKFRLEDNILDQDFTDHQYTSNVALGALLNLGYKLDKKHIFSLKNMLSLNTDDITTIRTGLLSGENTLYGKSYSNIYNQNRIFSSQLTGEHSLFNKQRLSWVINVGNILRSTPDYRIATYAGEGFDESQYGLAVNNNQFSTSTGRFYSTMNEMIWSTSVNHSIPFKYLFTKNELKGGFFYQVRDRKFNSRYFTYSGANGILGTPEVNLGADNIKENGVYMVEQSLPARDNYDAKANLTSAYLMMDTRFFTDFRLVYGARVENYHQLINTADGSSLPLVIDSTYLDILPSLNFTWNYSDKVNFRLSAGKTVNRSEFRELAAFPFFNFNLNSNIAGNVKLQPAKIWNYDARWEWFPKPKEVISAGVFYKKITNPIEMAIDVNQASIRTFGYDNQQSAVNYGIELEYRKTFNFIAKATKMNIFNNIMFFTNLSLIQSKIEFNEFSTAVTDRPLQGQSPYVINTGLQYNDTNGWGVNVTYNRIGRRIAFVGAPKIAKYGYDIYENPRTVIDIQVSKSIKKWDLKLTIGDLLQQDLIFYQDIDNNKMYNESTEKDKGDNTVFRYSMGRTISAGVTYRFN